MTSHGNHDSAHNRQKDLILSKDPGTAVRETIKTIEVLRDIYVCETNALIDADTNRFLEIQESKLQAAHQYQQSIKELLQRKGEIQTVTPALKNQLQVMQKEFSVLAEQNRKAIERMQRCVDRLGGTIRTAAQETAKKMRGLSYSETGKIKNDENRTVSMGMNETA